MNYCDSYLLNAQIYKSPNQKWLRLKSGLFVYLKELIDLKNDFLNP